MKKNGARLNRLLAFLLTVMMLMTTCVTTAFAANIWDEIALSLSWTEKLLFLPVSEPGPGCRPEAKVRSTS